MSDTPVPLEPKPASVAPKPAVLPADSLSDEAVKERPALDPTRYGDWEKNGRCIDF